MYLIGPFKVLSFNQAILQTKLINPTYPSNHIMISYETSLVHVSVIFVLVSSLESLRIPEASYYHKI